MISTLVNGLNSIATAIDNIITTFNGIFTDVNFSDLYYMLMPEDMRNCLNVVIYAMLFLAGISLIKKVIIIGV